MKKKWKIILLSGLILIIGWIVFPISLRYILLQREEFLIKRNYHKNKSLFKKIIPILDTLPEMEINFRGDSMIVLAIANQSTDTIKHFYSDNIPTIWIYEDKKEFNNRNIIYPLDDFWFADSMLHVITPVSSFIVNRPWIIKYDGFRNNDMLDKILVSKQLSEEKLTAIQRTLSEINCSGFEKDRAGVFVINFRTDFHLIDAYSYEILTSSFDTSDLSNRFYSEQGKLDDNIYWFHYNRIPVEYFGNLKFDYWNK